MPRAARPWFRRGRSMWYVQVQGKQHALGVTDPNDSKGADAAFERLVAEIANRVRTPAPPTVRTVAEAAAAYLADCERKAAAGKLKPKALNNYRRHLRHFEAAFGRRDLASLAAAEIEAWASRPAWSPTTQHNTLGTVGQLFKFAKVVIALDRPSPESRAGDVVLSDAQFERVVAALSGTRGKYPGDLIPLLNVLRETGARPGEVSPLTAEGIDFENACTRKKDHKTRRYTGTDRIIHFNAAAMAVLRSQREKWGRGLLFRTRAGNAYRDTAIVNRLWKLSKRVGFRVIAYGLGRHSWATDALVRGVPDAIVAAAMGHVGTSMVHRHYSHVDQQARAIKDAMETARPEKLRENADRLAG